MTGMWAVVRKRDGSLGVEFIPPPDRWHTPDTSHVVEAAADVLDALEYIAGVAK